MAETPHLILSLAGDKSISHRALILAGMASGVSRLDNLSTGADVRNTRACLEACGISIREEEAVYVRGQTWREPRIPLDGGNSGTTVRLLLGVLAGLGLSAEFRGDESLSRRPMKRILDPLETMGIRTQSNHGRLPVRIAGKPVRGLTYDLPVASAQVKSALLLAGLGAPEPTVLNEKAPTRDHTERLLQALGVTLVQSGRTLRLEPPSSPWSAFELVIPGDPSTAAFLAAATLLTPGMIVEFEGLSLNPTRLGFYRLLQEVGGQVSWVEEDQMMQEPRGRLRVVGGSRLQPLNIDRRHVPGVIDELPILAVLAAFTPGRSVIRDAAELRVKESDRLRALFLGLTNLGVDVTEREDGLIIEGTSSMEIRDRRIRTFHDHRIAMAFAVAGAVSHQPLDLDDPDCVRISCPEFFRLLDQWERAVP
ncbi:MAG: 3-phosphoshikimate 1-carboxyvinyltransferase [Candidatus Neomarinimicrobiota bacterium]|nr:MAG: 3-phosphoshikimate 1-carboxyvinyltransferase [Candidatus Neomarinimicrobiota bacterium]